jgi:hypothetical protein
VFDIMNTQQKRTYLVYGRGFQPDDLKLGSLYLDPANPLEGERKRHISSFNTEQLKEWTGEPQLDQSCVLNFAASSEWLADAGVLNLIKGEFKQGRSEQARIEGKNGRRFQIKLFVDVLDHAVAATDYNRPETFLNEVLLKDEHARTWLQRHLSISRKMYYLKQASFGKGKHPQIWLVTGIQYITDAHITTGWTASTSASLGFTVPTPEPATAALAMLTGEGGLSAKASTSRQSGSNTAFHHQDKRIWAAQFTPLDAKFYPRSQVGEEEKFPKYIKLDDLEDLIRSGVRAEDLPEKAEDFEEFAEISQVEGEDCDQPDEAQAELIESMVGVDWDMFEKYLSLEGVPSETQG